VSEPRERSGGRSIRTRLTVWYLAALVAVMLTLAGGSWWLFRRSMLAAADNSLTARIEGVHQFIDAMQRDLKPGELDDELQEYGQLTAGEALLEVIEGSNRVLYRPAIPGWAEVRLADPVSTDLIFRDRVSQNRPYRVGARSFVVHDQPYRVIAAIPMGPAYAAWRRFGWVLALVLPGIGLAAAAGGYWISGRALAPVDRITRTVQAISLRSLDRRLEVPGPEDEIRRLAVTFNEMLTRLQSSVADVVGFTAEASHELRTPVSLIRTTAEIALSRPRTDDEYREALNQVLAQAERMSALVGDLLALARADAGVEPREMTTVDLRSLAEAAVRAMRPAADARALHLDLAAVAADVRGTPESLYRLILIVLDNAIKYTPRGGDVRIRVQPAGTGPAGVATIEITDTGSGIDPLERPYIFNRFYRGATARTLADGSGLGLSLAQTIVERHHGAITIESGPAGRGCRVHVRLPRDVGYTVTPNPAIT
jgi:signal transduction histidine kinase